MIAAIQQQQSQQAAIAMQSVSTPSCTPHLWQRYYIHFADFQSICGDRAADASALRGLETMTNGRIAELRRFGSIPADALPHADDLWIEVSGYGMAAWTQGIYGHATYDYSFISLINRGFLRRRFVAYPGRYEVELVSAEIHLNPRGKPFIIVDDEYGNYVDNQGDPCSAKKQGYTVIRRQYLYEIENVNGALAKLVGQSPPAPLERWHSLQKAQKKGGTQTQETAKSTPRDAAPAKNLQTSAAQGLPLDNKIRGERPSSLLFENKHITEQQELSLAGSTEKTPSFCATQQNSALLTAPWTAETLVALSALINHRLFRLPAKISEEEYRTKWLEPAQRLIEHRCADIADPSRAWELVEWHIWAMLEGPTWFAQGRTKKAAFSLHHVEKNWDTVAAEWRKTLWADYEHIAYTGPSIFEETAQSSYAQGYSEQSAQVVESTAQTLPDSEQSAHCLEVTAQVLDDDVCAVDIVNTAQSLAIEHYVESTAQTEQAVEVVAGEECAEDEVSNVSSEQPVSSEEAMRSAQAAQGTAMAVQIAQGLAEGMEMSVATALRDQIWDEHPDIAIARSGIGEFFLIAMEIALDTWYYLGLPDDYHDPTERTQLAIDAAERYGKQQQATDGNGYADSQGPPGYGDGGDEPR